MIPTGLYHVILPIPFGYVRIGIVVCKENEHGLEEFHSEPCCFLVFAFGESHYPLSTFHLPQCS